MNKKGLKIFLIVLLSILVVAMTTFFILFLTNKNFKFNFKFFGGHKTYTELVYEQEYETIFNRINIDSDASDILIKHGTDSTVKVLVYSEKDNFEVDESDDKLNVNIFQNDCKFFCFNMKISKVEIYLPVDYDGNINIENNYGNVKLEKFENLILDVKEDAGDIEAYSLNTGKIKNSYGDIKVFGYSKNLDIEQDCGDIEIDEVDSINAENNYGDIIIKKVNEYVDLKDDCGDIEIDSVNLIKDSSIEDNFGDIKIESTNEIYIDANTDLGDVKVNNNYHKSDITLKISNDCGDIEVNN